VQQRANATNLSDLLSARAGDGGDRTALVDGTRTLTWAGLDAEVGRVARAFGAHGLVAGHRIALAMENSIEFVVTYLATLRAGMVAVPLNPGSRPGEFARVLDHSGARLCVADPGALPAVRGAVAGLADALAAPDPPAGAVVPTVVVSRSAPLPDELALEQLTGDSPLASPRDPETLAALLYTSGTSGRPQAAMLTHRALLANVAQTARVQPAPITRDDVVLGTVPLFHVYGLNAVLGQVLYQGATLVLAGRFDAEETLALVGSAGATVVPVAPPALAAWAGRTDLAERLGGIRALLSGAAPLPPDVADDVAARAGVAVHQGYGLTEAAPVVTTTIGVAAKPGSVGRPLPGLELRVVDEGGHDAAGGDPGEILLRGPNLFSGYWPDGADGPDEDGWYATGDIGLVDADGDLFLVDRVREIAIVSGFNVYPAEVEDVIGEVPGVREAAVIGVPDASSGEAVVAYVVPVPDARANLADHVLTYCAARLARFKTPTEVHVVADLPHSANGKVAKGRLREVYRTGASPGGPGGGPQAGRP
jgi:long-chain acyl-CoA synthetase